MKTKNVLLSLALALASLWLTSCYSPNSHGDVYRQWSRRMAEMGIFPVYPPREDIVVGALPLHPYDTADPRGGWRGRPNGSELNYEIIRPI